MSFFNPKIRKGEVINNEHLMRIYGCGIKGRMRRSLSTNSLVLISNSRNSDYKPAFKRNGLWYFTGMGREGNQDINYSHNRTLAQSNTNRVQLFLFKSSEKDEYEYVGRVLLVGEPQYVRQKDSKGISRKVYLFPLIETRKHRNITKFLSGNDKRELVDRRVIEYPTDYLTLNSVKPIIDLMVEKKVNTLISDGGWFLTDKGYFHNEYSQHATTGKIDSLLNSNKITLSDIFKGQNKFINPFYSGSIVFDAQPKQAKKKDVREPKKIRIMSLIYNNKLLYDRVEFTERHNKGNDFPYITLFIGANGTGKSIIISMIQKIFLDIYRLKISKFPEIPKESSYQLEYRVNTVTYRIVKKDASAGFPEFYCGDESININELVTPSKVICCAFTLSDKFTPVDIDVLETPQYQYFGIKTFSKQEILESMSSTIVNNIMTSYLKKGNIQNLSRVTSFLQLHPILKITFNTADGKSMGDLINVENIEVATQSLSNNILEKQDARDVVKIIRAIRMGVETYNKVFEYNENQLSVIFNLENLGTYSQFFDEFKALLFLKQLGLFNPPEILINKTGEFFPIDDASSGEFQFLSTMMNIMTEIDNNSIIIIDEPETSLHPTWQNQYIDTLYRIFKQYYSSHFIIATHSHFLVSDLKIGHSSIVTLKRNINQVDVKLLGEETYGRTVEDILYNVFDLPSLRNYYVASDIDELLKAIGIGEVTDEIIKKLEHLEQVSKNLVPTDPLKLVIQKIRERINLNGV